MDKRKQGFGKSPAPAKRSRPDDDEDEDFPGSFEEELAFMDANEADLTELIGQIHINPESIQLHLHF
ncbi:DNA polymerase delta catalytic subunit [Frankliniella fusca]|uniref:DNA polymerase delta catalytic subunit n=1 Tax=Frankliniella fusca TaxID=407009 RepID=A0AAE1LDF6_9NEOP|nr:DNA polymerase delta catalytic subunit [Frankliniella fusca]